MKRLLACLLFTIIPAYTAGGQLTPLTIRSGDRTRSVPVVAHPDGGSALRIDLVAEALRAQFSTAPGGQYRLQLGESILTLQPGATLVTMADDTVPLTGQVYRSAGRIFVPFSMVSDLLPRIAGGLLYDAERRELRQFGIISASRASDGRGSRGNAADRTPVRDTRPPVASGSSAESRSGDTRAGAHRRTVVIDAGHGGRDAGMSGVTVSGRQLVEKDITLAVARQLRDALDKRGIAVVMTRSTDTLIALADRGKIANNARGDLFISVHVNAANPSWKEPAAARGFETYFLAAAKTDDEKRVESMENESIRFETSADASRHDPLGFIIRDMAQNEHLRESSRLADLVQRQVGRVHPGTDRGVKQAGFRVLVSAFMPAVLVEIGYGSNPADAAWMTDATRQRELAESIADATVAYLAQYERKVGGS